MRRLASCGCGVGLGLVTALLGGCRGSRIATSLPPQDSMAIAQVQAAYVRAWLADDTAGVLATLDTGAVLLPPGHRPVQRHTAIRAYWWPEDGSHTRITGFTWDMDIALSVFHRGPGGQWCIARQMWGPALP
jgi:hypothetical protein